MGIADPAHQARTHQSLKQVSHRVLGHLIPYVDAVMQMVHGKVLEPLRIVHYAQLFQSY